MNRVASPEYPDSIHDVIYQKGQYSCVNTARFAGLVPTEECVDAALRLLCGERRMVPSVVFQSNDLQGEPFTMYTDRRLGTTYFCLSGKSGAVPDRLITQNQISPWPRDKSRSRFSTSRCSSDASHAGERSLVHVNDDGEVIAVLTVDAVLSTVQP